MKKAAVLFFLLLLLSGLFLALSFSLKAYRSFHAAGLHSEMTQIYIAPGTGLKKIASLLEKNGLIKNGLIFQLGVRLSRKTNALKSGEYQIPPYASPQMIMNILSQGQTFVRKVTVPEGLTSFQIAMILDNAYGLTGKISTLPEEGSLLPDTYYYSMGDTKQSVLDRMHVAMQKTVRDLWSKRRDDLPFKTPEEAVILASIVEKETGVSGERAHVASVFINRLHKGMRLQSDPTVIYALSNGSGILERQLWSNDLKVQHTHNTYVIKGLPPSPIAHPGRAALEAVLNPMDTKDLYFVADGNGGHVFAEDLKEHNINVRRWRNVKKLRKTTLTPPDIPSLKKENDEPDTSQR